MGMLIFAILLSLGMGGAVLVLSTLERERGKYAVWKRRPGKAAFLLAILVAIFVFAVLAVASSYTPIQVGTVAVVTRFGGVVDYNPETCAAKIFEPGINWKWPFIEEVLVYSTQKMVYAATDEPQMADYADSSVDSTTVDGQNVTINFFVRFLFDVSKVACTAQNLGSQDRVVERIVKPDSRSHVPNSVRQFSAEDLYTERIEEYQRVVTGRLGPIFAANGLILDEFGVRGKPVFESSDYVDTIAKKQIELEKVTTARYEAQQAVERKNQTITEAEAQAESIRIRGEALRKNPQILQLELINKLGPNIRVILLPSGQQFILGGDVLGDLTSGGSSPGGPTP